VNAPWTPERIAEVRARCALDTKSARRHATSFIVHARIDLPEAIDEIERLRAETEPLREMVRLACADDGMLSTYRKERDAARDEIGRLRAEAATMHRGYVDLHEMLPGSADVWTKVGSLQERSATDADRAALDFAAAELRERRNNVAASYSHIALTQQDNTVTDPYRQHIARLAEAIGVVDRLRAAK
jgi:hypothetical protein